VREGRDWCPREGEKITKKKGKEVGLAADGGVCLKQGEGESPSGAQWGCNVRGIQVITTRPGQRGRSQSELLHGRRLEDVNSSLGTYTKVMEGREAYKHRGKKVGLVVRRVKRRVHDNVCHSGSKGLQSARRGEQRPLRHTRKRGGDLVLRVRS